MELNIVLVHSPIVGPSTWAPVSRELRGREIRTIVPTLPSIIDMSTPIWAQHAQAVARRLESIPNYQPIVLVGHSGAGPLLPAIGASSPHPVAAYVFVDASLPHGGRSQLEEIEANSPVLLSSLSSYLKAGGLYPEWTDKDLSEIVPEGVRQGVLADIRPMGLPYFEETMPYYPNWPEIPCGYIKFSQAYTVPAEKARKYGWEYDEFDAGHFHMLVDPEAVTDSLINLIGLLCPQ
ncbi:alpha/beta hydrolase [Bacillus tuaregi]|uniref:alpha/beta hydrolase n=1 Tax=Bacillus tuaregi TaxID=1816695 RepID=UPI0008F8786A|nr:alpha/beta hydrolase [Bacillus tuaregi]